MLHQAQQTLTGLESAEGSIEFSNNVRQFLHQIYTKQKKGIRHAS
jgi:hypothetical protein